jgi:hypothetical protein
MSHRNEGSYRERNGIARSIPIVVHVVKIASVMDDNIGPDPSLAAGNDTCARLESELADTRAALNLARERAEDAEADLEEARLQLDQFRIAPAISLRIRPAPTISPALIDSPAVTAIAAELIAVMAENDRRAAAAPAPAPAKRKRRAAKPKAAPAPVPAS